MEQLSGVSANAFVNARLTTVRAPVAGQLAIPDRALGSAVGMGDEIGAISDPLVDTIRQNDLALERALAVAELGAVTARLAAAEGQIRPMSDRLSDFTEARVSEIGARLAFARDHLAALEAGAQTSAQTGTPPGEPAAGADEADGRDPRLPDLALTDARERVAVLEIAIDAAGNGVFLGDGYNDAPYSEQRRIEVAARRDGLAIERDLAAARLAAIETRLTQERVRTSSLAGGPLLSLR